MKNTGGATLQKTTVIRRRRITLISVLIGVFLILTYWGFSSSGGERVMPGVQLRGLDLELSGADRTGGIAKLKTLEEKLQKQSVNIICQDTTKTVSLKEIEFTLNAEETMNTAFAVGQNYNFLQRMWQSVRPVTHAIAASVNINKEKLENKLKDIIEKNTVPPKDARLVINQDRTVSIIPGEPGLHADIDKLYNDLVSNLSEGNTNPVNLTFSQIKPDKTAEEIRAMGIDYLLGSFTTQFKSWQSNRNKNIAIAAQALEGLYVSPGETVSFNKVVGPRSAEAGYKSAGVIVGDEFNEDLGGGVCQVSTTLYNAVLLANLGIVERHNHSLPISYVPLGQDAAVAYEYLDFKFKNTTEQYIYIDTNVGSNYITFNVLGNKKYKKDIKIENRINQVVEPKVIYKIDSNLSEGQEVVEKAGSNGYKVSSNRLFLENGVVVKTEKLPSSNYLKVDRVIRVKSLAEEKDNDEEAAEQESKTEQETNNTKKTDNKPGDENNGI
ncbi:VanW family protein [Desulfolucanica intricata]|uniref:VanW family protein n=1 Tax=Desulfolucanica intricata TaxID=1285191 RepID=UPI0008326F4E|nr:VanW family protein [Desulfolucanica intricata]